MNKSVIVTVLLTAIALLALHQHQASSGPYSFQQYKAEYNKQYLKVGEEEYRKTIFLRNLVRMNEHNSNPINTWKMGINQFSDLTEA